MASFAQEDHLLVNHKVLGQGAQHLQTLVETPLTNDSEARKNVEKESEPGQMVSGRDPMVGREILITKGPLVDIYRPRLDGSYAKGRRGYTGSSYCGYVGTIRSSSEGLNVYNVHIGSIGTIVQVHRDIVLDRL
jgi:hypothetical protein